MGDGQHIDRATLASAGFADGQRYDAARPDYPVEAVDFLVGDLDRSAHVVDLGAGTGIFTRHLASRFRSVTAVEPTGGMRSVLAERLGEVEVLAGRDTDIPLDAGTVDAVTVAQAFHWFDAPRALAEIHRVLVPGGRLGLVWNERDEREPWVWDLSEAMRWHARQPYQVGQDFGPVVAAGPFRAVERRRFPHHQVLDHRALFDRVLTTSYIAVMDDDERAAVMAEVAEVVDRLPEPVTLPYVTDTYRAVAAPKT